MVCITLELSKLASLSTRCFGSQLSSCEECQLYVSNGNTEMKAASGREACNLTAESGKAWILSKKKETFENMIAFISIRFDTEIKRMIYIGLNSEKVRVFYSFIAANFKTSLIMIQVNDVSNRLD